MHSTSGGGLEFQELLSLDHIRDRMGAAWDARQRAVFNAAQRIIERHKNGPIAVERHETCFRLTFRCASRAEALQRTIEIAGALDRAIIAQFMADPRPNERPAGAGAHASAGLLARVKRFIDWLGGIDTPPSAARPSSRTAATMAQTARIAPSTPGARVAPAAPAPAMPPGTAPIPPPIAPVILAGAPTPITIASATVPAALIPTPLATDAHGGHAVPVAATVLLPGEHDPVPTPHEDDVSAIEMLLAREGARLASEQRTLAVAAEFPPPNLQFVLRPIWSIKTGILGLSTCLPAHIRHGTELCLGYDVLPHGHDHEMTSFLDELVLRHVIGECRAAEHAGRMPLIVAPVHYENLSDPDRLARYRRLCDELPRASRKYLSFELWGIGEAYGHHQVLSILSALRAYSAMQFGMVSPRQSNLAFWKSAGLHGVGLDVAHLSRQWENEKVVIETVDRFRLCAYRAALRAYARGVPTRSIALACVAAGYDFIDGAVIQRATDAAGVCRFSLPDLYGMAA